MNTNILCVFVISLSELISSNNAFFNKGVKYMPMGYEKKPKCPKVPSQKQKGGLDVWMFLASMAITTNIAANLANK